jgi:hypothetical protein
MNNEQQDFLDSSFSELAVSSGQLQTAAASCRLPALFDFQQITYEMVH